MDEFGDGGVRERARPERDARVPIADKIGERDALEGLGRVAEAHGGCLLVGERHRLADGNAPRAVNLEAVRVDAIGHKVLQLGKEGAEVGVLGRHVPR